MTHLTADELIDAMEGELAADRQAHLAACDECRRQLDELASVLNDAKQTSVPEPSPLFWQHFSARVNHAIDDVAASAWPRWLRWQVLLPIGVTAIIILGLMITAPKPAPEDAALAALELQPSVDATSATDNWGTVAALVGEIDLETASAAGVIEPGSADQAILQLTIEEREELSRLLQAELTRVKS